MNTHYQLAQPLTVSGHTLRNRIIMGSMHTGFEEHHEGAEHLAAFYAERAKNGVALIITGGISPNTQGAITDGGAKLDHPSLVPWHQTITSTVHQYGAKICLQILHAGRYAMHSDLVAPSEIQAPINPLRPRALTTEEVQQTIQDYIQCAKLAQQAGYDGVEIMGSEGYLINQFIAPATNHRQDQYGGTLANRHRFAIEIAAGIRSACRADFIIIFRISLLDLVENGSTWEENQQLAQQLQVAGVSMFNTGIGWHEARIPTIATMVPRAAFAQFTGKLKHISQIPVIATNRINMPAVAEKILSDGLADAVCLARPFLADAAWAKKALAQQDEQINTCIACNQACLDHIFAGKLTSCLVNPFACHELQWNKQPATYPKKLAVIGAGPAGIAFSITAAERGHHITLFEASDIIGGQLNLAKQIPGKPEFQELIRYFNHAINQPNIQLKLNQAITSQDHLIGFDEIIIATGIKPRTPKINGIDHHCVLSYLDVLQHHKPTGNKIAIIGSGGIGFDIAEYLSTEHDSALSTEQFLHEWQIDQSLHNRGALNNIHPNIPHSPKEIWLLQRKNGVVGKNLGKTTGWIHRLILKQKQIHMLNGVEYHLIDDQGLHITHQNQNKVLPVDNVVICAGQEPNNQLIEICQTLNKPTHIIGGAKEAGEIDAKHAIKMGTELALTI